MVDISALEHGCQAQCRKLTTYVRSTPSHNTRPNMPGLKYHSNIPVLRSSENVNDMGLPEYIQDWQGTSLDTTTYPCILSRLSGVDLKDQRHRGVEGSKRGLGVDRAW